MIKTDITAYVNSYEYNGELITPSQVLTSTKQDEELNLAYSPNFTLKLNDAYSYINDMVEVTFSYGDTDYTAYANVINRSAGVVTLQYNSGLTAYVNPPAPPVVHTLEFSPVGPFSCSYDTYSAAYTNSYEFSMLYDNEALKLGDVTVGGNTYCTIADGETSGSYVFTTTYNEVGEYSDTVTITYNELNAYCTVNATITDSTPEHTLEFSPVGPFSCSYDNYTEEKHMSDSVWLLYDNSYVDSPRQYITNDAGPNAYTFTIPTSNRINFGVDYSKNPEAGEYNEIYTASYEGLTAYCNVTAVVTDSTPMDPFEAPIEISAPPTDEGAGAYYVESEQQAPEVNIHGDGLTYDYQNNNYVFVAPSEYGSTMRFEQPVNYTINTIRFVGMESTYRLFINDVGPGPIVNVGDLCWDYENPFCSFSNEDGDLVFTMLGDYDPSRGNRIEFDFDSPIGTMGTDLTFEKIMIEFTPYNPAI